MPDASAPTPSPLPGSIDAWMPLIRAVAARYVPAAEVSDVAQDTALQLLLSRSAVALPSAYVASLARRRAQRHHRVRSRNTAERCADDTIADQGQHRSSPAAPIRAWLSEVILPKLHEWSAPRGSRGSGATPREIAVVTRLAAGATSLKSLATELRMAPHSVRAALRSVAAKIRRLDVPPPDT